MSNRIDSRKEKRAFRKMGMSDPVMEAYYTGQDAAMRPSRFHKNPYPKGRRRDEWNRGFTAADPIGDHHGRNV